MSLKTFLILVHCVCVVCKQCPSNFYWDDVLTICTKCDEFCYANFNRTVRDRHICAKSEQCAFKNLQISKQLCHTGQVYDPIKCTCEICNDCHSKIEINYNCSFGAICNYTCNGTISDNSAQFFHTHVSVGIGIGCMVVVFAGLVILFVLLNRHFDSKKNYYMLHPAHKPQPTQTQEIQLNNIDVHGQCETNRFHDESEQSVISTEETKTGDTELKQADKTSSKKDNCPPRSNTALSHLPSPLSVHKTELISSQTARDVNDHHTGTTLSETKDNKILPATDLAAKQIDSVNNSLFLSVKRSLKDHDSNNDINAKYTTNVTENVTFHNENQSSTISSVYDFRSTSYDGTKQLNNIAQVPCIKTKDEHGHKTADEIELLPKNLPVIPNIQNIMKYLASEVWVKRLISNGKFIRVTFDTISLKDANYLVGQNTKLPSNQYECIHKSQAVKMY